MSSRSVILAGNQHSCSDTPVAALTGHTRYLLWTHVAAGRVSSGSAPGAGSGPSAESAGTWRNRFVTARFAGLSDEPRPGVPRTITDAQIEEVVVRTLEEAPEGATHWSKRELARQVGLSPTTIHRIWRAFGLKPWLVEEFKVSTGPFLIDKVRDVVGLYLAPPANAAVFSVDELCEASHNSSDVKSSVM